MSFIKANYSIQCVTNFLVGSSVGIVEYIRSCNLCLSWQGTVYDNSLSQGGTVYLQVRAKSNVHLSTVQRVDSNLCLGGERNEYLCGGGQERVRQLCILLARPHRTRQGRGRRPSLLHTRTNRKYIGSKDELHLALLSNIILPFNRPCCEYYNFSNNYYVPEHSIMHLTVPS